MQIILNDEEIEVIYEALLTELAENVQDVANDERRGRNTTRRLLYGLRIDDLRKRFEPYIK